MPRGRKANQPERVQKAYDLRKTGMGWPEIGAQLGVAWVTARNYANLCEKSGMDKLKEFRAATPEIVNPEKTAEIIDKSIVAEHQHVDHKKFVELAVQAGMPEKMAAALAKRLSTSYGTVMREVKLLKNQELADTMRGKIGKALEYLDDYALANSASRDLAVVIGILTEKMQLMEGKPIAMYSIDVTHRLETMMPKFLEEARRRGITVDAVPSEKLIEDAKA